MPTEDCGYLFFLLLGPQNYEVNSIVFSFNGNIIFLDATAQKCEIFIHFGKTFCRG